MSNLFLNDHGRVRSGWRVVSFLFLFFLLAVLLRIVEEVIASSLPTDIATTQLVFVVINSLGLLFISLCLGGIVGKIFEQIPFRALGASFVHGWFRHFAIGLFVGALTLSLAVLLAFLLNGEKFQLNQTDEAGSVARSLVVSFIVFAFGAAWEEAFFRGYILQTFSRSGAAWLAVLLTSVFFGLVHLGNDDATLFSTVNTVLAGLWFSFAYFKTRDLWFVFGLHLMWNWTQGSIFGIEVSGLTFVTSSPLLKEIDSGPTWITGANYGIEGGIACTVAILGSIGLIYFMPGLKPAEEMLKLSEPPA